MREIFHFVVSTKERNQQYANYKSNYLRFNGKKIIFLVSIWKIVEKDRTSLPAFENIIITFAYSLLSKHCLPALQWLGI